jgi:hypothetical protein
MIINDLKELKAYLQFQEEEARRSAGWSEERLQEDRERLQYLVASIEKVERWIASQGIHLVA